MANFDQEVSHLVLMKSSNYATLDDYIYLPNTQFNITLSHPDTVTLDLHIPKENNVLICFQIKKDFQVVLDNFDDINEIWKEKKIKLKEIYKETSIFLCFITESRNKENAKVVTKFSKKKEDVLFAFTDTSNVKYFYEKA